MSRCNTLRADVLGSIKKVVWPWVRGNIKIWFLQCIVTTRFACLRDAIYGGSCIFRRDPWLEGKVPRCSHSPGTIRLKNGVNSQIGSSFSGPALKVCIQLSFRLSRMNCFHHSPDLMSSEQIDMLLCFLILFYFQWGHSICRWNDLLLTSAYMYPHNYCYKCNHFQTFTAVP